MKILSTNPKAIKKAKHFVKESSKKHNNKYDYSKFEYVNVNTKSIIICPTHGEFLQSSEHHLRKGQGCSQCANQNKITNKETFVNKSNNTHNSKYDYSKFIYIGALTKGIVICSEHGEFLQSPDSHSRGAGCPKCANKKSSLVQKSNVVDFIEKANKIHNSYYDYSKYVYVDAHTKGIITCPIHSEFLQNPNNHLCGNGCPKCKSRGTSFPEQVLFFYLSKLRLKFELHKKIEGVELDIYIPYLKLGIEYDGEYFHRNKLDKDLKKNLFFKERGIDIIRIREEGLPKIKHCFNICRKLKSNTNKNNKELEKIIHAIIKYINTKYNKNYNTTVDIEKDKNKILAKIKNKVNNSIVITHPEIAKQWHPTKNEGLLPEHFAKGNTRKVWWLHENGQEWFTHICTRCRSKTNNLSFPELKDSIVITHPQLAKQWHPIKNKNIDISDIAYGSGKTIWWQCEKGHEWKAMTKSRKRGCPECNTDRKPNGYWSIKENCHQEALKYTNVSDFHKKSHGAYQGAKKEGFLKDILSHITSVMKPMGYWTKEHCQQEALKYTHKNAFQNGCESAYKKALNNKWLDEICSHMESGFILRSRKTAIIV